MEPALYNYPVVADGTGMHSYLVEADGTTMYSYPVVAEGTSIVQLSGGGRWNQHVL